jgi:hypothetical protein
MATKIAEAPTPAPRFAKWLRDFGEEKVAEKLGVSVWTVFKWRQHADGQPNGAQPRTKHLAPLIRLAGGKLSAVDIYPPEKKQ